MGFVNACALYFQPTDMFPLTNKLTLLNIKTFPSPPPKLLTKGTVPALLINTSVQ